MKVLETDTTQAGDDVARLLWVSCAKPISKIVYPSIFQTFQTDAPAICTLIRGKVFLHQGISPSVHDTRLPRVDPSALIPVC